MLVDVRIYTLFDRRRPTKEGTYPIKLAVYCKTLQKRKLYSTGVYLTEDQEAKLETIGVKVPTEVRQARKRLSEIETKAEEIIYSLDSFDFDLFEKRLFRKKGEGQSLSYQYQQVIEEHERKGKVNTANIYKLAIKSFSKYLGTKGQSKFELITFQDITPKWLKEYEYYHSELEGRSLTTTSIYIRTLKAVFNKAIDEEEISKSLYPFGKRKYQVPATKNAKRALSKEQLSILFNSEPKNQEQRKAKDFWFFSYACSGMNMKDIALLKYKNLREKEIVFYRAKTKSTSRTNLKPISISLNEYSKSIIAKYGQDPKHKENFIFPILKNDLSPQEQTKKIKAFTRYTNQHLKKLCAEIGLPTEISTYWARHSFSTQAILNGASLEFVQESLGHQNIKTTQNYFAGFTSKEKEQFASVLMDFKNHK